MIRRLMPNLILCLILAAVPIVAVAAEPAAQAKPVYQIADMQFSDTPLQTALEAMFKNSGKTFVLDPALQQFKVTAVLKNVGFDTALTQMLLNLGATYEVAKDGVYHIKGLPQQFVTTSAAPQAAPASTASYGTAMARPQGEVQTTVSDLKYINAYDAANVISKAPGVQQVSAANGNRLIIQATPEGANNAAQIIAGLDSDKTLPRPIRLKLTTKITVTDSGKPKTYEATTESVCAEHSPSLLNLYALTRYETNYSTVVAQQVVKQSSANFQNDSLLDATITPSIGSDGRISLVGRGHFEYPLTPPPGNVLSKAFDLAASVSPGKPYTIASGSMRMAIGDVAFTVSITATPEEGRVPVPPPVANPQGGYREYGPAGGRGNYGGANRGSSYGGRSW